LLVIVYILVALAVIAIGGLLISYFVSRGEESKSHYQAEEAFEARVKKKRRADAKKRARERNPWEHKKH
jgi:Flp pilus assembly protein TadB